METTRLFTPDDAEELAQVLRRNRAYLAPWEPLRDDAYFTAAAQRGLLNAALKAYAAGAMLPLAIVDGGRIAGRITLSGITRGAFQSASVGYWVAEDTAGRGVATAALAEAKVRAFTGLGLHRLQAETLLHNTASQRVLARNGFTPFGIAPRYLRIAGEWQDHIVYQVLNEDR
ncbi:GNAT family N-acetyltransferase [Nocardiopsis coralliicola]